MPYRRDVYAADNQMPLPPDAAVSITLLPLIIYFYAAITLLLR